MQQRLFTRVRAFHIWLMAPLLGFAVFVGVFATVAAPVAQAATTSSTLNFQARLLNSSGGIVPDGNYNIDFKIYNADSTTGSVGTCSGACVWEETRTNAAGHGVPVINGYFSVNLGSVTAFGSSINWDQQLWLTMNIGGTSSGSVTWDGEMQNSGHSIALTALPYAFTAGQLALTSGANRGTLAFSTVANSPNILLPDASGTVCLQGSGGANGCGYEGTAGNDFIQNQTAVQQTASFNINGTGQFGTSVQAPLVQTADSATANTTALVVRSGNETGSSHSSGSVTIKSGDAAGGTNSSSGNIVIDSGSKSGSGTTGSISIGTSNSTSILIGNTGTTTDVAGSIAAKKGTDFSTTGTTTNAALANASLIRLTGASAQTIDGIAGGRDGYILNLVNAASQAAVIVDASNSTATAANQVVTGTGQNYSLAAGSSIQLVYDSGANRWRVVSAGASGVTAVGTYSSSNHYANGASITGNTLTIGSANTANPGLVDTSAQTFDGTKTFNDTLSANNTHGNTIAQFQDNNTSVMTIGSTGLVTLQPAASLTSGQSALAQTLTNASTTGGTINGLSQTITVSNTSSASTTNGYNIALTDATTLANINRGLNISLTDSGTGAKTDNGLKVAITGSNGASQIAYGIDVSTNSGIGIKAISSSAGSASAMCGGVSGPFAVGICGDTNGTTNDAGVLGLQESDNTTSLASVTGAGVSGYSDNSGTAGSVYVGAKGLAAQSAAAAYTSVGLYGKASGGTGATVYGGYFDLGTSSATAGAALYATNGTAGANILQLQDGSGTPGNVLTVADEGAVTLKNHTDSATAFQVQKASSSNTVLAVDTSGNQVVLGTAGTGGINGKLVFSTTNASNTTISILAASTATSYSLTLPTSGPALSQCLQNDGTTVGQLTFGPCGASGTFLNKNSTDTSSAAGGSGYLYGFTSSGSSTGGVLSLNNSTNTGSTLNATTAGNPASGKAVIYGENTNASPSGNLIDLRSGSTPTSKFSVDASGNILFGGTLATNTFTSTSLTFAGAGSASLQSAASQALNITGNASSLWQVGGTNQNLTIQTSGTGTLALDTVGLGTVSLGAANAGTINIGNNNSTAITTGGTSVVGTIANKVQGLTTTLTGAASNSSYVVKSTSNSNGTFQVQNSSGNKVFSVDTTAGQTVLGQSNSVNGSLLFQNSTNTNGITLNTTSGSGAYTLTLPTAAPAGGLCIETSPGNASQLVFASCSNNNASIQEVAYWDANNQSTVSVSPSTAGDEMVLTTQIPTGSVTVTGVSGGGVPSGGWSKVIANSGNGTVNRVEMWVGTVTTTGSSTITVTYSSSPGSNEITTTEFTAAGVNASTSWGIESSASQLNSSASTTVTYPNVTAVSGSELYVGYAQVQNPPASNGVGCNTSNFNYQITSTQHNMITYNTSLTANTAYQPIACQNTSGQSNTVAGVLTAFVTSSSINNTTSLQKANFYVQAATSGTVAGVLQAASSGSADIFDLRNSGGTNVFTVGSTGNVLVKPAASATALQVQNGSGYSVMAVDTSGNSVVLGDPTHLAGSITFKDAGDSNSISITAPSTIATTYSLALPTNSPTAGLCLATSPSNANQLIFSSCATQVSAATISYVGKWDNAGSGVTSISTASPTNIGDLMVFYSHTGSGGTINTISGGGVASGGWSKVTAYTGAGTPGNIEMWRGIVSTTGTSAVTVTYTGTAGTNEIVAEEFTMGSANGTWAIDTSGTATTTSSVTTVNYPTLTPLNSNELYAGYAYGGGTMSTSSPLCGSTSGFTYVLTGANKCLTYKTNVTGGTPYTPTATQTSGVYASVAAIVEAYVGTSVIVNTTATQQANFNVQASVSGSVAGVLQGAASGSADVLQVKDGSGINVMTVNTSNVNGVDGVTLGTSNSVGGQLTFNSSGNSNSITIEAPSAPGASYYLTLPTTTPAPGQCLATSPSNANQLVFSSCANQVTSIAISFVNNWKVSTSGLTPSLTISPTNVGDLITFFLFASKGNTVTSSPSGCGITWTQIVSANSEYMYRGIVTSAGSCSISVGLSTPSAPTDELAAQEWTTGSATGSWVVDSSGTISNASSATVTYPSLTPQSTKDLYVGYAIGTSTMSAGSTSGYTYFAGAGASMYGAQNTSVSATTQPTASQSTAGTSIAAAGLIAAYSSSSVISNSTVTQEANFNIQAATSGSVAGTLQAFSTGTGDILDLLDGSGTLVDKVDYQGNLLVRPSTAGATAFQVQNTSNVNVLSVDTSLKQVVVGAGATGENSPSLLVLDNETGTSADPTEVNGAMYYNATTHSFRCGEAGAWQNCGGLLYANTSKSSANSNCSNNCAAFSTAASVPANYCQAGKVLRISANGYFSSQASATTIQFGVYYGTDGSVASNDVLIGSVSPAVSVTSASNNYFQLNLDINCFSTTSMQAGGALSIQATTAAAGLTGLPMNATAAATVVTTSTKNLYIFPIWSAASASNTATLAQFGVNAP